MRRARSSPKRLWTGVALCLVLGPTPARAQEPPPRFPTAAELVTVDVVVLDRDGKPVAGLTRDDFVVREDGRPQAVTAFESVEALVPALAAPDTVAATSPSTARVATNVAGPPTRRTFAIVFDDLHIGDLNVEQARRAVQAFLDRDTRSGDRLMLLTTSDARYWATTRGPGDADFRSALVRVASRRLARDRVALQMSPVEAMRIADTGDGYVEERVRRRRSVLSGLCVWTGTCCECRVGPPGLRAVHRPAGGPERGRDVLPGPAEPAADAERGARGRATARRAAGPQDARPRVGGVHARPVVRRVPTGPRGVRPLERRRLLPRRPGPGGGAGVPLRGRHDGHDPGAGPRADARPVEDRGRGLEGARRGDGRARRCRRTTSWQASRGWPTSRG